MNFGDSFVLGCAGLLLLPAGCFLLSGAYFGWPWVIIAAVILVQSALLFAAARTPPKLSYVAILAAALLAIYCLYSFIDGLRAVFGRGWLIVAAMLLSPCVMLTAVALDRRYGSDDPPDADRR